MVVLPWIVVVVEEDLGMSEKCLLRKDEAVNENVMAGFNARKETIGCEP